MIDIHYWPTPNGKKVTILLEELEIDYQIIPCDINRGDQFNADFLKISPNNRMPAMVDHDPSGGGNPVTIFESGAIMMYIAEKEGRFFPQELRIKYEVIQWVMWQMANQGPKLGECGHFRKLENRMGDQNYAVQRFTNEANRLYGVLNNRLFGCRFLVGNQYTIADMICYPWCVVAKNQGQDISDFVYLNRWFNELSERPAVKRGMKIGSTLSKDSMILSDEELKRRSSILYNQRARLAPEGGLL